MKLDVVYEYVKNYFKDNFLEAYLIFDGRIEYIENKYIEIFKSEIRDKYDAVDIKNSNDLEKIDLETKEILNNFITEHFTERQLDDCKVLYNYVKNLLVKRGVNVNYSEDIFEHIVKLVMARVWSQFDRSRLNKEDFDHVINLIYNNICNQYARMIDRKIEQILDHEYDFFKLKNMTLEEKKRIKRNIITHIFVNGNKDYLVKLKTMVVIEGQPLSGFAKDFNEYIDSYFSNYSGKNIVSDKVLDDNPPMKKTTEVVDKGNSVKTENKDKHQNNAEITFNRENMRNNSVQKDGMPKKMKLNEKQIKVAKTVALLALLGALLGVGAGMSNDVEYTDDEYAIMRVEMLSNFDYARNWGRDNKYYNEMANEIITLYSKLGQLPNEAYKTLGFYNAYEGFCKVDGKENALVGMETIFSLVTKKIVQEDINVDLREIIRADSEEEYFYLDFVYDRLIDMGFDEIRDKKYQDVLLRYKYANFGNHFGVVGVFLSEEEKALIDEIMAKYVEGYEKAKKDIGYLMVDGNYTFFNTYGSTTGKGM